MTPSQKLARARHCFQAWLAQETASKLEADHPDESSADAENTAEERPATLPFRSTGLSESIFICDGFYRGRRFRTENASAIWFTEEDELKIHNASGACVATMTAQQMAATQTHESVEAQPVRRAA